MPNIMRFGSGGKSGGIIKQILRGTYTANAVSSITNFNIPLATKVVPQNCAILIYTGTSSTSFYDCSVTEDTLTIRSSGAINYSYEVIEFDKIKSLQRGAFNSVGSGVARKLTLTPVVMEKSLVLLSVPYHMVAGRDLAEFNAFTLYYTWRSNSEIFVYSQSASDRTNPLCWNVVEFE